MARNKFAERSHQRPRFREELMRRGDQRENLILLLGNQDTHGKRITKMSETEFNSKSSQVRRSNQMFHEK